MTVANTPHNNFAMLSLLHLGGRHIGHNQVKYNANDMSPKEIVLPILNSPIPRKQLERLNHIIGHDRGRNNANDTPETPLLSIAKTRRELFPPDPFTECHDRDGHEKEVVSRIKAMPESTVRCGENKPPSAIARRNDNTF